MAPVVNRRDKPQEGLPPLNMGGLTGNTLDSHRMLTWIGDTLGPEVQNRVMEECFKAYFWYVQFALGNSELDRKNRTRPPSGAALAPS